ncbi:MAG TPA: YlzJ-like family protein, partial [Bacillales bacterium]|nr:YlzJ-like family protein [Bacillales bacterium]
EGLEESVKKQKYMEFGGRHLLIEPVSDESYKVVRLVSSDPQDYLDTRYQPGNILSMKPQI